MKRIRYLCLGVIALFLMGSCQSKQESQLNKTKCNDKVTSKVNPFLGVKQGNTMPGACEPFGMVRLSPDVVEPQPTSGYDSEKPIAGFSHTHTHGTGGGPRYGNIMVIPQSGDKKPSVTDYAAVKRVNEFARPGFYMTRLARKPGDVYCRLTATRRTGFHNYRFFTWGDEDSLDAHILLNVSHTNTRGGEEDARCTGGEVKITSDTTIRGKASFKGGWGQDNPYTIYFYALFDTPFQSFGTWNDSIKHPGQKQNGGQDFGAYGSFYVEQDQEIKVKVGISYISSQKAKANLYAEIPHWKFQKTRLQTGSKWNDHLQKIDVHGGTAEQEVTFYSCLRNTMVMPTDVTGENPNWDSETPHYWDFYCIWDIYRTAMPLYSLILPDRQREMIQCMLEIYDHKGWLPDSWVAGDYSNIQGGTNADVVIADAINKNLGGFDKEKAYRAMVKNADTVSDNPKIYGRYLEDYKKYGYVTSSSTNGASSTTLEYAYNDYCISQVAEELGKEQASRRYLNRSQNCFQLFHEEEGYFWAKDTAGNWQPDFSKTPTHPAWDDPYFYEGGTEIYTAYVPHDMQGLIDRMGGDQAFIDYLDRLFSKDLQISNEPIFLIPYAYHYAGRPDKTAERVRDILRFQYFPGRKGLPGQDDAGAMSSWYVFSSMGFFPVAGQDVYLIGSPVFEQATIQLENGNTFTVKAPNTSAQNKYVQSATLNGKALHRNWFRHTSIKDGGTLVLEMGSEPSDWGRTNPPPSVSNE